MKAARAILGSLWFIHFLVLLGLLALWGFIEQDNKYLLLCVTLSLSGAVCGAFIRVMDAVKGKK